MKIKNAFLIILLALTIINLSSCSLFLREGIIKPFIITPLTSWEIPFFCFELKEVGKLPVSSTYLSFSEINREKFPVGKIKHNLNIFEDDYIKCDWDITNRKTKVKITNKSPFSVIILWNDAVIKYPDNTIRKIISAEDEDLNKYKQIPDKEIEKDKLEEFNFTVKQKRKSSSENTILVDYSSDDEISDINNKFIHILLPVQISENVFLYDFKFLVKVNVFSTEPVYEEDEEDSPNP